MSAVYKLNKRHNSNTKLPTERSRQRRLRAYAGLATFAQLLRNGRDPTTGKNSKSIHRRTFVQRTAVRCNTLHHTVTRCNTLQHATSESIHSRTLKTLQHDATRHSATHCSTLQHAATHTATHCHTLQHTATHCNRVALQHTALISEGCPTASGNCCQTLSKKTHGSCGYVTVTEVAI